VLPSINYQITPVLFSRIVLLGLTYLAIFYDMVYIQSIGSEVWPFAGLTLLSLPFSLKQHRYNEYLDFIYPLDLSKGSGLVINKELLTNAFKAFMSKEVKKHPDKRKSKYISLWLRVQYLNSNSPSPKIMTLSSQVTFEIKSNHDLIITHFTNKAILKSLGNGYDDITLLSLVFHYKLLKTLVNTPITNFNLSIAESNNNISNLITNVNTLIINELPIPITTNIIKWGIALSSIKNITEISMPNTDFIFKITSNDTHNHVILYDPKNKNQVLLDFKDYFGINEITFHRVCKNQEFYYVNGLLDVSIKDKPTKFFRKPKSKTQDLSQQFFTLDIETKKVDGVLTPIIIGIASKFKTWAYNINQFRNADHMLAKALKSLLKPHNDGAVIYIHNMAKFDIVFLLRVINNLNLPELFIEPIVRHDLVMSIQLTWVVNDKYITIRLSDSYLILPASLRKLGIAFNAITKKSWFPFSFMETMKNSMLYEGLIPDISFYPDITNEQYLELKKIIS